MRGLISKLAVVREDWKQLFRCCLKNVFCFQIFKAWIFLYFCRSASINRSSGESGLSGDEIRGDFLFSRVGGVWDGYCCPPRGYDVSLVIGVAFLRLSIFAGFSLKFIQNPKVNGISAYSSRDKSSRNSEIIQPQSLANGPITFCYLNLFISFLNRSKVIHQAIMLLYQLDRIIGYKEVFYQYLLPKFSDL